MLVCSPVLSVFVNSLALNRFRFDDFLEWEVAERLLEYLGERGGDKIVNQTPGHHESRLPGAVYYFIEDVFENLPAEQQVRDVEFHISDRLHVHAHLDLLARSLGNRRRLNEVIWNHKDIKGKSNRGNLERE